MIERKRFSFSALLKCSRSERLCIGLDSPLCLSALLSAYSVYYSIAIVCIFIRQKPI